LSSRPNHQEFVISTEAKRSGEIPVFASPTTAAHTGNMNACVYILSSTFKSLYIGVTSNLEDRIEGHKTGRYPDSFTDRYKIHHLVYFEQFSDINTAIAREKQLKRWSRIKKLKLIIAKNSDWKDISEDWGKPTQPFSGKLKPATVF
jgi:putative endonuclease